MRKKTIKQVKKEIEGILCNIELAIDKDPSRNRFEFEGEKYCWIIRTPEQVEEPPSPPVISTRGLVLELMENVSAIKEKLGVKVKSEASSR